MKNSNKPTKKKLVRKTDRSSENRNMEILSDSGTVMSDQMSSCNSDYAPSSHSSGTFTDD